MNKTAFFCLLSLVTVVDTYASPIGGVIIDKNHLRVGGAHVRISGQPGMVVSDENGVFSFKDAVASSRPSGIIADQSTAVLHKNTLRLSNIDPAGPIKISMHGLSGRTFHTTNLPSLKSFTTTIPLSISLIAGQCIFVNVSCGAQRFTLRANRNTQGTWSSQPVSKQILNGPFEGTMQATELSVAKSGYQSATIGVNGSAPTLIMLTTASSPATNLVAAYSDSTGRITLGWTPPVGNGKWYIIYRSTRLDSAGNPIALRVLDKIPFGTTMYTDLPALNDGTYYYALSVIDSSNTEGAKSAPATCTVGSDLAFTINSGDLFTLKDTVSLSIIDNRLRLSGVVFTDMTDASKVPIFTPGNPRNLITSLQISASKTSVQWLLPKGAATKTVWAEVSFKDGSKDTLSDRISIQPWNLSVTIKNDTLGADRSLINPHRLAYTESGSRQLLSLYRPFFDFALHTGGDISFTREFDCWVAVADSSSEYLVRDVRASNIDTTKKYNKLTTPWLETTPQRITLTGNPGTDSTTIHRYDFNPATPAGKTNLSSLTRTAMRPGSKDPVSTFSIPGRVWGTPDTVIGRDTCKTYTGVDPVWSIRRIKATSYTNLSRYGGKEIALIIRGKGTYFDDARTMILSPNLNGNAATLYLYSFVPPVIIRDGFEYRMPLEGENISSPFSIETNTSGVVGGSTGTMFTGYVRSLGGASITSIELLFSRLPSSISKIWVANKTYQTITYDSLLAWKQIQYPSFFTGPVSALPGATWQDIDPSTWPQGDYLMSFISEDEFGNKGIAPFLVAGGISTATNPQRISVQSAVHEYRW